MSGSTRSAMGECYQLPPIGRREPLVLCPRSTTIGQRRAAMATRPRRRSPSPAIDGLRWRLHGAILANSDSHGRTDRTPAPGKHTLALVDLDGRTLATVAFEVRGRSVHQRETAPAAGAGVTATPHP